MSVNLNHKIFFVCRFSLIPIFEIRRTSELTAFLINFIAKM
jgi:hypothetical protein